MGKKLFTTFRSELSMITGGRLKTGVAILLEQGHDAFLQWPASSTGKYHPPDEVGPMGMVIHVKRCVAVAPDIAKMYSLNRMGLDILVSASILHDLYKQGRDGKEGHTVEDHMMIIHERINEVFDFHNIDPSGDIQYNLANACLFHEGRWTPPEAEELDNGGPTVYATAMHTIDMMVTRRCIYDIMQSDWVVRALISPWRLIDGG